MLESGEEPSFVQVKFRFDKYKYLTKYREKCAQSVRWWSLASKINYPFSDIYYFVIQYTIYIDRTPKQIDSSLNDTSTYDPYHHYYISAS